MGEALVLGEILSRVQTKTKTILEFVSELLNIIDEKDFIHILNICFDESPKNIRKTGMDISKDLCLFLDENRYLDLIDFYRRIKHGS